MPKIRILSYDQSDNAKSMLPERKIFFRKLSVNTRNIDMIDCIISTERTERENEMLTIFSLE